MAVKPKRLGRVNHGEHQLIVASCSGDQLSIVVPGHKSQGFWKRGAHSWVHRAVGPVHNSITSGTQLSSESLEAQ